MEAWTKGNGKYVGKGNEISDSNFFFFSFLEWLCLLQFLGRSISL